MKNPIVSTVIAVALVLTTMLALLSGSMSDLDKLTLESSLRVENYETNMLKSSDGTFSCGFYSIYTNAFTFSIWYSNSADKTVVWSANRGRPVHSRRSSITLQKDGAMVLMDYDGTTMWQAVADGVSFANVRYAQLLDTGNLVMKNSSGDIVWQSFNSPTDTLLPTQHITATTKLVSTTILHAPGHHIFRFSDQSILSLMYDDSNVFDIYWPDPDTEVYHSNRTRYNSTRLGVLDYLGNFYSSDFTNQQPLVTSDQGDDQIKRRLSLDPDGNLRVYSLDSLTGTWSVSWIAMAQPCKIHGLCGPYGICHYSPTPKCSCPPGYKMKNPRNWTDGCRAVVDITCGGTQPMKFLQLPNTDFWGFDQQRLHAVSVQACKNICMSDCTCKGFQYEGETASCYPKSFLFNGRTFPTSRPLTMYLKLPKIGVDISYVPQSYVLAGSTTHDLSCGQENATFTQPCLDVHKTFEREPNWLYFYGFLGAFFVIEVFFIVFAWFFILRQELRSEEVHAIEEGLKVMTNYFRRYSYKELVKITQNFKDELGRGSSGIVYKGILDDERTVAVKRLENVRRGEEEFQAELCVIGRINHMNLVRIWGFCSQGSYRMLVSEYIEEGSLANVLFKNKILLQWGQRFSIALGVAKGLAYLHHECLEWVIHCDVKPENIFLDQNLEPKITDFGLAKLLSRGASNKIVSRVRGTIGYIAPEWVSALPITAKADVYSYGVVLLELVSGMRVSDLAPGEDDMVPMVLRKLVLMLADKLDRDDELLWISEFADFRLCGQFNYMQARALIKLAVSCLEHDAKKRPTMESIAQTLVSIQQADSSMKESYDEMDQ